MNDNTYATPIDREARASFERQVESTFGKNGLSYEEVTLKHLVNFGVSDVNNNPASPFEALPFSMAADDQRNAAAPFGPRAASLIRRTQSPVIDAGNKIPGAMAIGIFGVAAVALIANVAATIAPTTIAQELQAVLGKSVLRLEQGGSRIYELLGPEFMSWGDGQRVDGPTVGAEEAQTIINSPVGFLRGRKLLPVVLGTEQELKLSHFWDKTTAANPAAASPWSSPFQVMYLHSAVIARRR